MRKTLVRASQGAVLKRGSFYRAKYNTLKFRLGSANKAKVAIANRLARTIFKVMGGASYRDVGYMRGDPREELIKKKVRQLKALGVNIEYDDHQRISSKRTVTVDSTGIHLS